MKIAILGDGQLGSELFETICEKYFVDIYAYPEFNICNNVQLSEVVRTHDVIVNCAANINVDKIENEQKDDSFNVNYLAVKNLAVYCKHYNKRLVHISTDYIYGDLYTDKLYEEMIGNPINQYGIDKYEGEKSIISEGLNDYLILRVSGVFGKNGAKRRVNFIEKIKYALQNNTEIKVVEDQIGNITSTKIIIKSIEKFIKNEIPNGIYNLTNDGPIVSRYDIACFIKEYIKSNCNIVKCKTNEFKSDAKRQLNSNLCIDKIKQYIDVELLNDAIKNYLDDTISSI